MTDAQKEVWKSVQESYVAARAIALAVLPRDTPADVVQAATATILIQHDKAAGRAQYAKPTNGTPAAAPARTPAPHPQAAPATIPVPHCPKCGGGMWDNRANKRNPKGPDFKCKDKSCVDDKGFGTALWERDVAKMAHVQSFAEPPAALAEDPDDSGLPF